MTISKEAMDYLRYILDHPDFKAIQKANEKLKKNGFEMRIVKNAPDVVSVEFQGLDLSFLDR